MAKREERVKVLVVGGGMGGVAAALGVAGMGVAGMGVEVMLTEATGWVGGQMTSQFVPPDENGWVETVGGTKRYRGVREGVRQWYRENRNLTEAARKDALLNPGGGAVSHLCHEPKVSVGVMEGMLKKAGVKVLLHHEAVGAGMNGDRVEMVRLRDMKSGEEVMVWADYFVDATELGDLLPLTGTEYVTGAESKKETGELHARQEGDGGDVQSFTWCLVMGWDPNPGASYVIEKPAQWERWRDYVPAMTPKWPGKLLSWVYPNPKTLVAKKASMFTGGAPLWKYRKVVRKDIYVGKEVQEATLMNWPQNDYWGGNVIDQKAEVVAEHLEGARQLSLSLMYWLQTVEGFKGLCLRPDLTGTADGLAMAPYYRESRRIKALFTVTENHVGVMARYGHEEVDVKNLPKGVRAEKFLDSVGVGYYRIDLHPTTGGRNYLDIASLPFEIPLGAMIPRRVGNLLAGCKNIGTTHITNGCYRLHPVEWNIGESAGLLAGFCVAKGVRPAEVREKKELLAEFQGRVVAEGIAIEWPT